MNDDQATSKPSGASGADPVESMPQAGRPAVSTDAEPFEGVLDDPAGRRRAVPLIAALLVGLACVIAGLAFILTASPPGSEQEPETPGRGIIDYRLEQSSVDLTQVPALVAEMGPDALRSHWTRIMVHWATLQPKLKPSGEQDSNGDGYVDSYVTQLDGIIEQLHDAGMKIILTPVDVPEWASDSSLWDAPPKGYVKGTYQPFYAMDVARDSVLREFKAFGTFLARRYKGKAEYFECWNEPNLGSFLYPQQVGAARDFGAQTYMAMLKQWHAGVKEGAPGAVVIAGATAPRGGEDEYSTTAETFARSLKEMGAADYCDAYSHHPYTPLGTTNVKPGDLPNNPDRCVTLGNLDRLTKLFPTKPFYLTEYGYNTEFSMICGVKVSPADQARYLREGYAYVRAHYPQVKALLWFLVDDWSPTGDSTDPNGIYMGVRTIDGVRKPSWYAFAGGNSLSLEAPEASASGESFRITGRLTYRAPEPPERQVLTVQRRKPEGGAWTDVASVHTELDGAYSCAVSQKASRVYRVVWDGVCESREQTVALE